MPRRIIRAEDQPGRASIKESMNTEKSRILLPPIIKHQNNSDSSPSVDAGDKNSTISAFDYSAPINLNLLYGSVIGYPSYRAIFWIALEESSNSSSKRFVPILNDPPNWRLAEEWGIDVACVPESNIDDAQWEAVTEISKHIKLPAGWQLSKSTVNVTKDPAILAHTQRIEALHANPPKNLSNNNGSVHQKDVNLKGLKLSYLLRVFRDKTKFEGLEGVTVEMFVKKLLPQLMPEGSESVYAEYLLNYSTGKEVVGEGQVYVSCVLKNNFLDTLHTLEDHFRNCPDIFICMDGITHRTPVENKIFNLELFEERIKQLGYLVVVLSPWNNIGFYRRSAVLFEIYCAVYHDCKFEIALSSSEKEKLVECVKNGGAREIQEALEWIDFSKSECGLPSMGDLILKRVVPHDVSNLTIINVVRDCLTAISHSSENSVPKQRGVGIEQQTKAWLTKIMDWTATIEPKTEKPYAQDWANKTGKEYPQGLYEGLSLLIFRHKSEVKDQYENGKNVEFLNKDVFRKVMSEDGQSVFQSCSEIFSNALGKRDPDALRFLDLYVFSLFLSAHLKSEELSLKRRSNDREKPASFYDPDNDRKIEVKLQEAEDKLFELMMLWESNVENIEQYSKTCLTITFETALPRSFYRYMHRTSHKKLLLLCLNNTEYGGVWRITWIGISRKMVRCECTSVKIRSNDKVEKTAMKVGWEVEELFKLDSSDLSVGTSVEVELANNRWIPGRILNVISEEQFDVQRYNGEIMKDVPSKNMRSSTKSIYLHHRKDPPKSSKSQYWQPMRAFFAPIPKFHCSCTEYSLLGVDLVKQTFRADVLFEFRLNEIGKDATCEKYVLEYLNRYGFDLDGTIDFRDEIISGIGSKATVERSIVYEESSSKSFLFDYKIQMRKQSEYAANLELHDFPFDQQKLSIDVSLNISKLYMEIVPDSKNTDESAEPNLFKLKEKRLRHYEFDTQDGDNLFGNEYYLKFADNALKKPWSTLTETKSHWKMTFSIFIRRKFSFYIYSAIMPLMMFCLLSFLTFGVLNDCSEMDTATRCTISLTLLLSAVAFKVSISAFLPQVPYFTLLDTFMWCLTGFISLLAVENIAWPAAVCTNLRFNLGQQDEENVMYCLLLLLLSIVAAMFIIEWKSRVKNNEELCQLLGLSSTLQATPLAQIKNSPKVHPH